jgi:hypothetical protein
MTVAMNATTAAELSAIAEAGTLVVILISVVAAVIQLRHIRTGNQLQALLSLEHLSQRLEDPEYRRELETIGFVDPAAHPEMVACNWLNEMGTLVKRELVSEDTFMDLFARLIVHCWRVVSPAIAIMRRTRGDAQYHDFEYLAARAAQWLERHPSGRFPRAFTRMPLPDPWRDADRRTAAER